MIKFLWRDIWYLFYENFFKFTLIMHLFKDFIFGVTKGFNILFSIILLFLNSSKQIFSY